MKMMKIAIKTWGPFNYTWGLKTTRISRKLSILHNKKNVFPSMHWLSWLFNCSFRERSALYSKWAISLIGHNTFHNDCIFISSGLSSINWIHVCFYFPSERTSLHQMLLVVMLIWLWLTPSSSSLRKVILTTTRTTKTVTWTL